MLQQANPSLKKTPPRLDGISWGEKAAQDRRRAAKGIMP
jgi:hypothetical protein